MEKHKIIKKLILNKSDTILEAIRKINQGFYYFQLVVHNKKLIGTVSDGDIRRALLRGIDLNDTIDKCMNNNPIKGYEENFNKFQDLLDLTSSVRKFLPVVNKNNILKYIILDEKKIVNKSALVMAGGFGTRLGNKTKNTPKPLLKIANKSMLELILKKLEQSNYNTIYVSTHYLHEKIVNFLNKRKSLSKIKILNEKIPLGTAGSISKVKKKDFDFLTVINGDIVSDINFNALSSFHLEKGNAITVTVAKYTYQIPFGEINIDENKNFKSLEEKPTKTSFVLSGIYCLNKKACQLIENKKVDMPVVINKAYMKKMKIGVFPIYEYWRDVGNSNDYILVNKERQKSN